MDEPSASPPPLLRSTTPCGDRIERQGAALTVHARFPIEGLEARKYRKVVLVFQGARFTLLSVEGDPAHPTYRLQEEQESLYERPGEALLYDGDRHLTRRRERRAVVLGTAVWLLAMPLLPLIGMLPHDVKQRLLVVGIDASRATRLSINVEWLLLGLLMIAYPITGGIFTLPGLAVGCAAMFVGMDILYRVSAELDNKSPAMGAVAGAFAAFVREVWRDHRRTSERGAERLSPREGED